MIERIVEGKRVWDLSVTDETSSIDDLDLSVRTWKCVCNYGIHTIGDLIAHDGWFFFNQDTFGKRAFEELITTAFSFGFRLSDCTEQEFPTIEPYLEKYREARRKRLEEEHAQLMAEIAAEKRERARLRARERRARLKAAALS